MHTLPKDFYIVLTNYLNVGWGSTDPMDRANAYNHMADSVVNEAAAVGEFPCRVFRMCFDLENGSFESAREVTDEFRAEMRKATIAAYLDEPSGQWPDYVSVCFMQAA